MKPRTLTSALQDEFVGVFSAHSRRIYSFIITLVVYPQDADEVFQNTSLALWRKRDEYEAGTSFWAWACKVAYYEVLRHRKAGRREPVFSSEAVQQMAADLLARESKLSNLEQSLHDCIERLAADDHRIIELRYYHEKSPKQIAELQSCSVHAVYRVLSRIHERLHRCMQRSAGAEGGV